MKFESITFQNIFSYGKKPSTFNFEDGKSVNIIGKNGDGKSALIDIVLFALTGKPFRQVKMGSIPNNINKKNCLVDLRLTHNAKRIIIKRGLNPKIFEMQIDGKIVDEMSSVTDQQSMLENLLSFNSKTIKHILIMSSMGFTPFLKMSAADKRMFIDELFQLNEYTSLQTFIKQKFSISI